MKKCIIVLVIILLFIVLLLSRTLFLNKISFDIINIEILDEYPSKTEYKYYELNCEDMDFSNMEIRKVRVVCDIENLSIFPLKDVCMEFRSKDLPDFVFGKCFDTQLPTALRIKGREKKRCSFYFLVDQSKMHFDEDLDLKNVYVYISDKRCKVSREKNMTQVTKETNTGGRFSCVVVASHFSL